MREHSKHKIKDVLTWNRLIPAGTVVVLNDTLITRTTGEAYAFRKNHNLVQCVHVCVAGEVLIENLRIPSDLGGEFVDRRYNAI